MQPAFCLSSRDRFAPGNHFWGMVSGNLARILGYYNLNSSLVWGGVVFFAPMGWRWGKVMVPLRGRPLGVGIDYPVFTGAFSSPVPFLPGQSLSSSMSDHKRNHRQPSPLPFPEPFWGEEEGFSFVDDFRADGAFIRREKEKARQLRSSPWWKNRRSNGICHYCGRHFPPRELTMDHLVPIARGGRSTKGNLVPCCKECNTRKNTMLPLEWAEYVQRFSAPSAPSAGSSPAPSAGSSPAPSAGSSSPDSPLPSHD